MLEPVGDRFTDRADDIAGVLGAADDKARFHLPGRAEIAIQRCDGHGELGR